MKKKLAVTDWLLDHIVYRLYGLTDEKVAIVEDRHKIISEIRLSLDD